MTYSKELKIKSDIAEAIDNQIGVYERMLEWEKSNWERFQKKCEDGEEEMNSTSKNYYDEQIRIAEENLEACKKIVSDLLKKF